MNRLWPKKPFQLLDKTAEGLFNYGTGHPLFASVLIYILVATTVFFNFYFHPDGLVWGDGYYYLSTAKAIANGELWQDGIRGAFEQMSSHWPLGYPVLIGSVSNLFDLQVFWASKMLNLASVALIVCILHYWLYPFGWVYSLCFLSAAMVDVVSLTLSEPSFLLTLMLTIVMLCKAYSKGNNLFYSMLIGFLLGVLFLIRYVSGFAFLSVFIISLMYFRGAKGFWTKLSMTLLIGTAISSIYCLLNYWFLDSPFGNRVLALNDPQQIFGSFIHSSIMLLIFPINLSFYEFKWILITLVTELILLVVTLKKACNKQSLKLVRKKQQFFKFSNLFLFCYLVLLFIARTVVSLEKPFDFRILLPAFFLSCLGIINYLHTYKTDYFPSITKFLILTMLGSFFLNLPVKAFYSYGVVDKPIMTYPEKIKVIKSKYQGLFCKSGLVINGSQHLSYTMNNLRPIEISSLYDEDYNFQAKYLKSLVEENRKVFLNVNLRSSIKATLEKHDFTVKLKSDKGLLNLYEIKQSD